MHKISKDSVLWDYFSEELQGLVQDGENLLEHAATNKDLISDFSYLVFPYSKAYEGFLKQLFLDLDLIKEDDYYSDDIRIGRILNPHFLKEDDNVFDSICTVSSKHGEGREIAERLWTLWKRGRNQVFHYFPHNFRKLSYEEAVAIVGDLVEAMELAITGCHLDTK